MHLIIQLLMTCFETTWTLMSFIYAIFKIKYPEIFLKNVFINIYFLSSAPKPFIMASNYSEVFSRIRIHSFKTIVSHRNSL